MDQILIERNPSPAKLEVLGAYDWPIWSKEASTFPWTYDEKETCYFLEGEVVVTPRSGEPVHIREGDLVTFPQGLSCTWAIRLPVTKHYRFG